MLLAQSRGTHWTMVSRVRTPEFDEYTIVLRGCLHVMLKDQEFGVEAGQAIIVQAGEWVQYSSPSPDGAEYIAACIPAFSPDTVHRERT